MSSMKGVLGSVHEMEDCTVHAGGVALHFSQDYAI